MDFASRGGAPGCKIEALQALPQENSFSKCTTMRSIGSDKDHVHFLLQSVPTYSPTKIARTVKSITAREIFAQAPGVKRALWGGAFWGIGFYINTAGRHSNEKVIAAYVKNQGNEKDYEILHKKDDLQLNIF
ncbi:IS200/IS605 family transposase [Salinimicrobium sp. HB62]|uniref:IS200/IS605 family transposase n=1 Tax=Salinimicrobium sp. HB62 TaxID=3077781 RepID=UPI002D779A64|nr:IS200/IS605 family transposase [Salinimicrobium sp. HB62]